MMKKNVKTAMFCLALAGAIALAAPRSARAESAAELNNEGVKLYQEGNFEDALDVLNKALKEDPENLDIQINLGYAWEGLGKTDEAIAAYKTVIAADPENLDAHNVLGGAYYNLGQYDKARAEWEFALSLDPGFQDAADNLKLLEDLPGGGKMAVSDDLTEAFNQGKTAYRERRFEDGMEGDIDVSQVVRFTGVFAGLKDLGEFAKVRVDAETGTICWPNGADVDPLVLYARLAGVPVTSLMGSAANILP